MGWDSPAFSRRYKRIPISSLFLQLGRWFTPLLSLLTAYVFSSGSSGISQRGFPHSEIPGSKLICSSPGLIAAYRVLHRLLVPRHSPYTLSSLTIRNSSSRLAYATRQLHAHCVCVVGKNYRLQNIQLSKIPPSHCALRWASRLGDLRKTRWSLPTEARVSERRLVEDTALEPVTSWLQTRRS